MQKKKSRYIKMSNSAFVTICLFGFMLMVILSILFYLEYVVFGEDTFNDIKWHLLLFMTIGVIGLPIALFYKTKVIYFNQDEIIFNNLFIRNKVYRYEEIISARNILKDKIIVYTTKGKFKVDNELSNTKKFLKVLEDKNIPIEIDKKYLKWFRNNNGEY